MENPEEYTPEHELTASAGPAEPDLIRGAA